VSIRFQLLLVALATLVLPWAGCEYARELETALRVAQENALLASADTIARALSAEPQRVFRDLDDQPFDPALGDIYVFALHGEPLLDGYREGWDIPADLQPLASSASGIAGRLQAGTTSRYLFLYLEVEAAHFLPEPSNVNPVMDRFDRVNLSMLREDGTPVSYFFATNAPGLIGAQTTIVGEGTGAAATARAASEPRIQAFWLQNSRGYHLEARLPLSMVGPRLWIEVVKGDSGAKLGIAASDPPRGGRLFFTTPKLGDLLATFIRTGTRATVIDSNALKLGETGELHPRELGEGSGAGQTWYRRFMAVDTSQWPIASSMPDRLEGKSVSAALAGQPYAEWLRSGSSELLLSAASPINVGGHTRGAVVLEQAGDQFIDLRDRALQHLFNFTLATIAVVVVFLFGFATWISVRIGRLRNAADEAVGADGMIRLTMPESASADELGALARGFERLLARLNEHTQYLRTLGGKLSHELRTPLTIVRSSLDNLESEGLREDQREYFTRARDGTLRLQSILSALGAAARVEESIKQAERVNFDLRELLISAVGAYRDGFPDARFDLETPPEACNLRGAPDLIIQMLDKLVENAVDFCPKGGLISVRLRRSGAHYELAVINDGAPIPDTMLGRLFESLIEQRTGQDDKPHFGLGLYIVRLVAEFHGGRALAANRAEGGGAAFTVLLPMI
jgi:two-component system, OmpR family, sensor histidine kinase ChvG